MAKLKLDSILNNKTRGSSELVHLLNDYFSTIGNDKQKVMKSIELIKAKLNHFQAVRTYLNELQITLNKSNKTALDNFFLKYERHQAKLIEELFNGIYPKLKKMKSVITISRSGTVLEILRKWYRKNKKINVVVCESRPMYEGRMMASDLAKAGIKVKFITDSMIGLYINQVDAAIIGADAILKNGNVINKVGSKSLALHCGYNSKPIYVVTSKSKFSNKNVFKPIKANQFEVWDKKIKNLSVQNFYFEEIEKQLITKIIAA